MPALRSEPSRFVNGAAAGQGGAYFGVPIVQLYGHRPLLRRLGDAMDRAALPSSLLFTGARGVGKQRLALWLAQRLLCDGVVGGSRPCGACGQCRYSAELTHPDLHWFFPRPRLKDPDASAQEVRGDYAEAIAERVKRGGLYGPASGADGIYVSTVRAIVQQAALSPALARRKVIVVGDAERMVPQEGADYAANAFLKLLEEPLDDTTILMTSSEPGALLPTIRSRVVSVRVGPIAASDAQAFLADPVVTAALATAAVPAAVSGRLRTEGGAPGALFSSGELATALAEARQLLDAAVTGDRADRMRTAFVQGASKARGAFSDTLDALTVLLHDSARQSLARQDEPRALAASKAVDAVDRAKLRASGNVNPQLVSAALLAELSAAFR
jgi:DNA polymerase-3 subunit delta'